MPQALAQVYLHIVFSTMNREPYLVDDSLRRRAHIRIAGICRDSRSSSIRVGGVADHVHILCALGLTASISELIQDIKGKSSQWVKNERSDLAEFAWQEGYGAFSISRSNLPKVDHYVRSQEEHHRQESYQDEYRRFLTKYGIDYDENDVWN